MDPAYDSDASDEGDDDGDDLSVRQMPMTCATSKDFEDPQIECYNASNIVTCGSLPFVVCSLY